MYRLINVLLMLVSCVLILWCSGSSANASSQNYITAADTSCIIAPGEATCGVDVSWSTFGVFGVCVWRIHPALPPAKWKCMASGTNVPFNLLDASGRTLELRSNSNDGYSASVLLDSINLIGSDDYSTTFGNGSNYAWYYIDPTGCSEDRPESRFNYVVLREYHKPAVRTIVNSQIDSMVANGQDFLRIPIYHKHCGVLPDNSRATGVCASRPNSSYTASESNDLPVVVKQNLSDLVEYAFSSGVKTVLIGFFPGGDNSPMNWETVNWPMLEENWAVIWKVKNHVDSNVYVPVGHDVIWDLGNEQVPASNLSSRFARVEYMNTVWSRWTSAFGAANSIGFSIIASSKWHITQRVPYIAEIYGSIPPIAIDVHLYGCSDGGSSPDCSEKEMYMETRAVLDGISTTFPAFSGIPIAIGESYFADASAAMGFMEGAAGVNELPLYVAQWPRLRGAPSNCMVAPPAATYLEEFKKRSD